MKSCLGSDAYVCPHRMSDLAPMVLVIDDDAAVREALRDLFESVGLRVSMFESAREFLRAKRPTVPCCLVLDVRLPGQSGLDLQRELNERNIALPIVFLTGHGDIPISVRAMKAGAIEFLTKPFREQDLLDAVQAALDRDRSTRADEELLTQLRRRCDALTPRERTVLAQQADRRRNPDQRGYREGSSQQFDAQNGGILTSKTYCHGRKARLLRQELERPQWRH